MAQKVQVSLVDDIDGNAADETIVFAFDGVPYEIDLSKANARKFRDAMSAYVNAARRSRGGAASRGRARPARSTRARGAQTAEIRRWARSKGLKVNERGRIPADIIAKYDAAH